MVLAEVGKAVLRQPAEVFLTASIGIAFCPRDAENVIDLIRNADAAMYHSKQNGGNSFSFYVARDERGRGRAADAEEQAAPRPRARRARDALPAQGRPAHGRIVGAEALLRWRLPGHGDISPSQFIPLAEENEPDPRDRRVGAEPRLQPTTGAGSTSIRIRAASRSICRSSSCARRASSRAAARCSEKHDVADRASSSRSPRRR
jgi:hypothetical protein